MNSMKKFTDKINESVEDKIPVVGTVITAEDFENICVKNLLIKKYKLI